MPRTERASRFARSSILDSVGMGKHSPVAQTREATNATSVWDPTVLRTVRGPRKPEPKRRRGALAKVEKLRRSRHILQKLTPRKGRSLALPNQRLRWQPNRNLQSIWYRPKTAQLRRLERGKGGIHGTHHQSHPPAEVARNLHPPTARIPQGKQRVLSHPPHSGYSMSMGPRTWRSRNGEPSQGH